MNRLRFAFSHWLALVRAWTGRSDGVLNHTNNTGKVEFREVFDRVLQEGDWIGLSAGALERSWRTNPASKN